MTDSDFWNVESFEDWMDGQGEECPECGYMAEKRQIENQEKCGRCWYNETGGIKAPEKVESSEDEGGSKWDSNQLTA